MFSVNDTVWVQKGYVWMMLPDPLGGILSGGSRFDMGFKETS